MDKLQSGYDIDPEDGDQYYKGKDGLWYTYPELSIANRLFNERMFEEDKAKSGLFPSSTNGEPTAMEHKPTPRPRETTSVAIADRRHSSRVSLPPTTIYTKALEAQEADSNEAKEKKMDSSSLSKCNIPATKCGSWVENYQVLAVYQDKHKTCNVQNKVCKWLARWVREQRTLMADGELSSSHREALDKLGFDWLTKEARNDMKWMGHYAEVKEFHKKHNHFDFEKDTSLANWTKYQRRAFKEKKLDPKRTALLRAIGFRLEPAEQSPAPQSKDKKGTGNGGDPLSAASKFEKQWMNTFNELKLYREQNGHFRGLPGGNKCGVGRWAARQREAFQAGKLNSKRQELLRGIGFRLADIPTMKPYNITAQYAKAGKEADVQCKNNDGFISESSDDEDNEDFEGLSLAEKREKTWMNFFTRLKMFYMQNGDFRLPERNTDLGGWARRQRETFQAGRLDSKREDLLRGIGFRLDRVRAPRKKAAPSVEVNGDDDDNSGYKSEGHSNEDDNGNEPCIERSDTEAEPVNCRPAYQRPAAKTASRTKRQKSEESLSSTINNGGKKGSGGPMPSNVQAKVGGDEPGVFALLMPIIDALDDWVEDSCLAECADFLQRFLPEAVEEKGGSPKSRLLFVAAQLDLTLDDSRKSQAAVTYCENYLLHQLDKAKKQVCCQDDSLPNKRRKIGE
ncbi:helicase [Seminavis robusta]|uniref:Helicase n=1 Tax=Seminavis robusta TaxID=568900 RepID=A0A9N8HN74_9STRA|nr:helicase [Seminavis robusta]|eukprot:Sro1060_g236620.1 helicase (680) ;mRNA; f:3117-5156